MPGLLQPIGPLKHSLNCLRYIPLFPLQPVGNGITCLARVLFHLHLEDTDSKTGDRMCFQSA
jgi:hypothetical protein